MDPIQYQGDTAFDRPAYALRALVQGSLGTAGRALVSPRSLSPAEHKTLADDWGVGQGNSAYDFLLRSVTNPLVLAGIIMATRFPIPRADAMFKYSKKLVEHIGPVLRQVGSLDDLFRGTPIPELYKKILREVETFRTSHASDIGAAIVKAEKAGLKWDRRTEVMLAAKLDGLDTGKNAIFAQPITGGPAFDTLVADVRGTLDKIWDQNFGSLLKNQKLTKSASRRITNQLKAQYVGNIDELKKQTTYWPHQVAKDLQDFDRKTQELLLGAKGRESVYGQQAMHGATVVTSSHAIPRFHQMVPDPKDLELVSDLLKPGSLAEIAKRAEGVTRITSGGVKLNVPIPRYSLQFMRTMSSYTHGMARAWGWSIADGKVIGKAGEEAWQGLGDRIVDAVEAFEKIDPHRAALMKNSYLPMALGRLTFRQALQAGEWNQYKIRMADSLTTGALGKWLGKSAEGTRVRDWITTGLRQDRGIFSLQNLGGKTAGYFYLSALGANPISAGFNTMQLLLTTVPTIGPKYAMQGLSRTLEKVPAYFKLRAGGATHFAALEKTFPHFVAEGLGGSPLADEAIGKALNSSWEVSLRMPTRTGEVAERVKTAMMSLFSASERLVRVATFEGAHAKALAEGLGKAESSQFARNVVEATQFVGGPAGVPAFARDWNPALKQFATFTSRSLGFTLGPGLGLGSGTQAISETIPIVGGMNPGTLGRTLLGSTLAFEAGRSLLDTDLSHGLLFGALPIPNPRSPFAPAPFIPPVLSVAGAVGQDLLTGKVEQTKFVAPLLVPGGVALSRLSTSMSPEIAKALGKDYADYTAPLPDGRVPLYTSEGSLRGYFTHTQVWARSLGVSGPTTERHEKELESYLLAQRDRIRDYRKRYLDSVVDGDTEGADETRREYEEVYPGMGGLTFRPEDMRAVYLRRSVPRLERMIATMPESVRGEFASMVTNTLAAETRNLIGVDPMLLQAPLTIRQRDPWREVPAENLIESLRRRAVASGAVADQPQQSTFYGQGRRQARPLDTFSQRVPGVTTFQPFGSF